MATRRSRKSASRKTRSSKRKPSAWNNFVKKVYNEMKKKNSKASFGDALNEASKRKKAGEKY